MSASDRIRGRKDGARVVGWKIKAAPLAALVIFSTMPAYGFLARPAFFAALGAITKAPSGWLQFCADNPEECRPSAEAPRDVSLTPDLLQQLFSINYYVNDRVKWTSDEELYGTSEHWAYPLDRGDCEDIVLLKRRLLAKASWPLSSLLITTVEGQGLDKGQHAVLTVLTDRGELILDNQTPEILFWYETNYHYLARQSTTDPNVWVSFRPKQTRPGTAPATQ